MLYHYSYNRTAPWDRNITITSSDVYETNTPIRTKADYEAFKVAVFGERASGCWLLTLSLVDPNPLPVDIT